MARNATCNTSSGLAPAIAGLRAGNLGLSRMLVRHFGRREALQPRLAIYGATEAALEIRCAIRKSGSHALVGLYEDRDAAGGDRRATADIDGRMDDLVALVRAGAVDVIVIALPAAATRRIAEVVGRLRPFPVCILAPMPISRQVVASDVGARLEDRPVELGGHLLVTCRRAPLGEWGGLAKTVLDRVGALVLLLCVWPLMLLIAAAIKLESRGPVLFRQRRHGLAGECIVVWKFRTMRVLEDGAVVRQACRNDPRITSVGALLRKSSLDELPQLFNVLVGEMSLVGPRPHAVAHNEHYGALIAGYDTRCRVRPGITGWAQINGFRGETRSTEDMAGRIEHDIWYVSNWSFWLDLKILLLTPLRGFVHKNAY